MSRRWGTGCVLSEEVKLVGGGDNSGEHLVT